MNWVSSLPSEVFLILLALVAHAVWCKMFIVMGTPVFHKWGDLPILTSGQILRLTCHHLYFILVLSFFHPLQCWDTFYLFFLTKKIVLKEKICSLCKWVFYTILEVDPWQNGAHFSHFTWRFDGNAKVLIYVINQVLGILQNFILNQGRGYRYFWIFLIVWISGQASPPFQNKKPFWISAWYRAAVDHRII